MRGRDFMQEATCGPRHEKGWEPLV